MLTGDNFKYYQKYYKKEIDKLTQQETGRIIEDEEREYVDEEKIYNRTDHFGISNAMA